MPSILDDKGHNQGFEPTLAWRTRTKRRLDAIVAHFPKKGPVRILEIGCGIGYMADLLAERSPEYTVIGTDICQEFIDQAAKDYKRKNLSFSYLDFNDKKAVQELISKGGKFDFVIGDGILHHLHDHIEMTAASLNSLLKDGGQMLFWEPNIINPYIFLIFKFPILRKKANLEPQEMAFSKRFIKGVLKDNGFKNIKARHGDFLIPVTPDSLVPTVKRLGSVLEKIPLINLLSQSIFIDASK